MVRCTVTIGVMPTEFTLTELSRVADVTPRTIRYYIAQGLLPSPAAAGTAARYSEDHLERLRAIKKLQSANMPLSDIRALLGRGDYALHSAAGAQRSEPGNSAVDYISAILDGRPLSRAAPIPASSAPPPASMPEPLKMPAVPAAPNQRSPQATAPDRGTWERIALHPDIELNVRRPLSRLQNKRVERLITIARQLLEEE